MNSRLSALSRRARSSRPVSVSSDSTPDLRWIHDGVRYRVGVWPDLAFERETSSGKWVRENFGEEVFASAALGVTGNQWRRFLEFVPPVERAFLESFQFGRMAALHVITRCPMLLE